MNEKPIERLNYYNGQRLEADDLKLEQEYHMRIRRWFNKSMFLPGIAEGLEVRKDSANPQQVIVTPGLALDAEGREIILLEEARVPVVGKASKEGQPDGNYLFIQYREETRAEESDGCVPKGNGQKGGQIPWGGPSRVRATPQLGWSDLFPQESGGKIVLAQLELNQDCTIRRIYSYPRREARLALNAVVRQFALEGERHIDSKNPGRIYFHIRGRQPNAITLYIRGDKFPTSYYTELGMHDHTIIVSVDSLTIPAHSHTLTATTTGLAGQHNHLIDDIRAESTNVALPTPHHIMMLPADPLHLATKNQSLSHWAAAGFNILDKEDHSHPIPSPTNPDPQKTFPLSGKGTSLPAGVTDPSPKSYTAHGGSPHTFVNNLQVYIGRVGLTGVVSDPPPPMDNRTTVILQYLKEHQTGVTWNKLGDGSDTHRLAQQGTGPIQLKELPGAFDFSEGEYYIDLRVANGGGRILFNLYVE